ncbi:MAG: membrane protein of unknown function [Promethearchaeota archaeon]|nr:MAG: membrane protein of unknown function [Candidatus Lokiarchaeota archaeon]
MKILDKLYQKINGSYFGFLGVIISLLSMVISYLIYIQVDTSFSLTTHFISDLGNGPNFSGIVFSIGMVSASILFLLFYIYLTRYLLIQNARKGYVFVAFGAALFSFIGGVFVGLFPSSIAQILHLTGGFFVFFGFFWLATFNSLSEYHLPDFNKKVASIGFLLAPFPLIYLALLLIFYIPEINEALAIFFEWVAYFIEMVWIFIQAAYMLKISP